MLGSSAIEVAIGLVFIYLLISLICSVINEWIAHLFNIRGKTLFDGIKNLLNDRNFTDLAQNVYCHGLLGGLMEGANNPGTPNRLPSYIPAGGFSMALLDILGARGAIANAVADKQKQIDDIQKQQVANPGDAKLPQDLKAARDELAALQNITGQNAAAPAAAVPNSTEIKDFTKDNLSLVNNATKKLQDVLALGRSLKTQFPDPIANIQTAVQGLPDGHTKQSLLVLLDKMKIETAGAVVTAEQKMAGLQRNIEQWFDGAMDRVCGWYKRWSQVVNLVTAGLLVVAANVDTIALTKRLMRDNALRTSIVAAADKSITKGTPPPKPPVPGATGVAEGGTTTADPISDTARETILQQSEKLNLPLGWIPPYSDNPAVKDPFATDQVPDRFWGWMLKLLGLAISMLAISLGAPFWFDVLSKFINIRGTGTPIPTSTASKK